MGRLSGEQGSHQRPSIRFGPIDQCLGHSRAQARGVVSAPSGCEGWVRPLPPKLMQKVHIRLTFPLMRGADMLLDVVLQLLARHALVHSVQFELGLKIDVADGVQNFSDSGINAWRCRRC
jgi:hypothetical protein